MEREGRRHGVGGQSCVLSFPFSTPGVLACDDSTADEAGTSLGLEGGGAVDPLSPLPVPALLQPP